MAARVMGTRATRFTTVAPTCTAITAGPRRSPAATAACAVMAAQQAVRPLRPRARGFAPAPLAELRTGATHEATPRADNRAWVEDRAAVERRAEAAEGMPPGAAASAASTTGRPIGPSDNPIAGGDDNNVLR
jgi:hypothetical protein